MHSEFRFTRHGGRSYDVSIRLIATESDGFSVTLAPHLVLDQALFDAIALGVRSAYLAAEPQAPLSVTVADVTDHSGATGELGFKICGEAAMNHLLGRPSRAPFPGYVLGEA
jgi:hypothetical protein